MFQLTVLSLKLFDFLFQAVDLAALEHSAASLDTVFLLAFLMPLTYFIQVAVALGERVPRLNIWGLARRASRLTTYLGRVRIKFCGWKATIEQPSMWYGKRTSGCSKRALLCGLRRRRKGKPRNRRIFWHFAFLQRDCSDSFSWRATNVRPLAPSFLCYNLVCIFSSSSLLASHFFFFLIRIADSLLLGRGNLDVVPLAETCEPIQRETANRWGTILLQKNAFRCRVALSNAKRRFQ